MELHQIRMTCDRVLLVSVDPQEIRVRDIVFFSGRFRAADYCLHRVYGFGGDRMQTFGDGNRLPDGWTPRTRILAGRG